MEQKQPLTDTIALENENLRTALQKSTADLAYTTRELEIEAALERVRSRTLLMKKSLELNDAVAVLFQQFQSLCLFPTEARTYFCHIDTDTATAEVWMTHVNGTVMDTSHRTPLSESSSMLEYFEAWKRKEPYIVRTYSGKALTEYLRFISSLPHTHADQDYQDLFNSPPEKIIMTDANFRQGNIGVMTFEPLSQEAIDILVRFARVFEFTYTRFLDLQTAENNAREAQIQLALERVRARTMAMQKSEELEECAVLLFQQIGDLGIQAWSAGFSIWHDDDAYFIGYNTNPTGGIGAPFRIPLTEDVFFKTIREAKRRGEEFLVFESEGDSLVETYRYMDTLPIVGDVMRGVVSAGFELPKYQVTHCGFFPEGHLMFITLEKHPEAWDLFKRFTKVFEQTYTRFLDLKRSEAHSREIEIDLALERVRAQTMAMHNSEEVGQCIVRMFSELTALGVDESTRFGIGILNKDNENIQLWTATKDEENVKMHIGNLDMSLHPLLQSARKAWQDQVPLHRYVLEGEDLVNYYQMINNAPDYKLRVAIEKLPEREFHYGFVFDHGFFYAFNRLEFQPDLIRITQRFSSLFGQTYRRYLDLVKAEGQAREAEIELALERVRARTMAMQKSAELVEVIHVVFNQFVTLNIPVEHAGFIIDYKQHDDMHIWLADKHVFPSQAIIPYFNCPHWNSFVEAKEKGITFFTNYHSFEEKNDFYHKLFLHFPDLPQETKDHYLNCPGLAISTVLLDNVGLYVENFEGTPFSEDDNATLMRFGKVFQQTFTRFLDLQKAESQAKEAQIEAALEKVRGKAMAMHNSIDLSDTASTVFTELRRLNIHPIQCGVVLMNKHDRSSQWYSTTSSDQGSLLPMGNVSLHQHTILENVYSHWLGKQDYFAELTGAQLQSINELLPDGLTNNFTGADNLYGSFLQCSVGCLYAWSDQPYQDDEISILKRFGSIFDLTFRRYMELQKSESNAREVLKQSALARIRADIAAMRTTADLDRITPLIWNELTILGISFIRCGVFIMDEARQTIHSFLSTPEGKAIAAFHLNYDTAGKLQPIVDHWQQNSAYTVHWDKEAFISFAEDLIKQGTLDSSAAYLSALPETGFHLHFLPFLQGMFYVGSTHQLNQEDLALIKLVAEAFSTAYARYEDFNRLEAAKQKVDATLSELKQAQLQLIQAEKMASLGELTAGIAHEIQNPLNFVNNFSDVNKELITEMSEEIEKGNMDEVKAIAVDILENEKKINHHGKRADSIVKGMLQHSRRSTGQKELTDINALLDEYLKLSYQAYRSKEQSFNSAIEIHFDAGMDKIEVVPQDLGRVFLNLFNNAFYAVNEQRKLAEGIYEPRIVVSTSKMGSNIKIGVKDNGTGIPLEILDRIYNPFFTTKPTGEGTGLGLSLSYDIIKAHGGDIQVETINGEGTAFVILLPFQ